MKTACLSILPLLLFLLVACSGLMARDRHVSVFYYPWYGPDNHWDGGYLRTELAIAQLPLLGEYSVRDPQTIAQHIRWSEMYGIDNWIMV